MVKLTIEEFYLGDKYDVMGKVFKDFWINGSPEPNERTGIELLIVKHVLAGAKLANENGDEILGDIYRN